MARNRNGETRYVQFKWNSFIDFLFSSGIWEEMEEQSHFLPDRDAIGHVKFKWNSILTIFNEVLEYDQNRRGIWPFLDRS